MKNKRNVLIENKKAFFQFSQIWIVVTVICAYAACEAEEEERREGSCFCEPQKDEVVNTEDDEWICPCWDRCPVGQTRDGEKCLGQKVEVTFSEATGLDACPKDVPGWNSRVPYIYDYAAILDDCQDDGGRYPNPEKCKPCAQSEICKEMFGNDKGKYWGQDWDGNPYSINLETGDFTAETDGGVGLNYRCARYPLWM